MDEMSLLLDQISNEHEPLNNGVWMISTPKNDLIRRMDIDYHVSDDVNKNRLRLLPELHVDWV